MIQKKIEAANRRFHANFIKWKVQNSIIIFNLKISYFAKYGIHASAMSLLFSHKPVNLLNIILVVLGKLRLLSMYQLLKSETVRALNKFWKCIGWEDGSETNKSSCFSFREEVLGLQHSHWEETLPVTPA